MDSREDVVSTSLQKDPFLLNASRLAIWSTPHTCMVCKKTDSQDEMMRMCDQCGGVSSTYIHMACYFKIPSYESSNGVRFQELRRCPTPSCQCVVRMLYNGLTYDFPNYRTQRWLFLLNPLLWMLAAVCSIVFLVLFTECYHHGIGGNDVCFGISFGVHALTALLFLIAFFMKTTEPIIYLETAHSKQRALRKIYFEMALVVASIIIGFCTFILLDRLYEVNYGFTIYLIIFDIFILPILGVYHLNSHRKLSKHITRLEVSLKLVSLASNSTWDRMQRLSMA